MSHWFSGYNEQGAPPRASTQSEWISWGGVLPSNQAVMSSYFTPEIGFLLNLFCYSINE